MNTAYREFKISEKFSPTPGPRFIDEGEFSGELLRKNHLLPLIQGAIKDGVKLNVDLDGTHGYLTSFLEEAFGGLIREDHLSFNDLKRCLEIISTEEPYLKEDIDEYLQEAHDES